MKLNGGRQRIDDATSNSFGACRGDATASEQCHLCHSADDYISFFHCFVFARTKKCISGATSELQWWHLVEAQVSAACKQTVIF